MASVEALGKVSCRFRYPCPRGSSRRPIRRLRKISAKVHNPWVDAIHLLWSVWIFFDPLFNSGFTVRSGCHRQDCRIRSFCFFYTSVHRSSAAVCAPLCVVHCAARLSDNAVQCRSRLLLLRIRCCDGACLRSRGWAVLPDERHRDERDLCRVSTVSNHLPWQMIFYMIVMVAIIAMALLMSASIRSKKNAALKLSQDEVRRLAATAERERIGRDLHDLLGHTLSLITLKLELSRKLFDRDADAASSRVGRGRKRRASCVG
jgi:two-component system sensor histidine kinase DesK